MKKIFIMFIVVFTLVSCTSNDVLLNFSVNPNKTPATIQHEGDTNFDLVTHEYDSNGRLVSWQDNTSNFKHEYFYSGDQLVERKATYGNNLLHHRVTYEYDNGLLVKSFSYDFDNELTRITHYEYDASGLPISFRDETTTGSVWSWDITYDLASNSITWTSGEDPGRYDIITYDTNKNPYYNITEHRILQKATGNLNFNNRLELKRYSNGELSYIKTYTNTYDSDGFLLSSIHDSPNLTTTYTFTYNE